MSLTFTKYFLVAYAFVYIIISRFEIPLHFILNPLPSTSILSIFPNILIFLINLITFTTDYGLFNIVMWVCRFIVFLEILPLIISLIGSIGNAISGLGKFFI